MNERIRELAEQAKGFVDLNQHVGGTNGCMVYTYDGLEKFAELIVRECIDCLTPLSRNHSMVGAARDTIKEHFGVE
jgi:hypothetical protein